MIQDRARHLRSIILKATTSLSDDDALEAVELFPHYDVNIQYKKDDRFLWTDNGKLYKVLQDHTSAAEWKPDISPSLYVEVTPSGVIPVWRQPLSAVDAYMTGDKVHYPDENGSVYISIVDNNVWEPDVYGWEEITEQI
jgi:hypothetical protein